MVWRKIQSCRSNCTSRRGFVTCSEVCNTTGSWLPTKVGTSMNEGEEQEREQAIQKEIYGFAGWITSFLLYLCYLAWALLPDQVLENCGITYFPDKYWALALPSMFVMSIFFTIFIYVALNKLITAPLDSMDTITDEYARSLSLESFGTTDTLATPEFADIPLSVVNTVLYK